MKIAIPSIKSLAVGIPLICAAWLSTGTAQAQSNYYFDPNGTNSETGGGSGTWDTTTPNWYNDSADVAFPAGNLAFFQGTASTVTIGAGGVNPAEVITYGAFDIGASTSDGTITIDLGSSSNVTAFDAEGTAAPTLNAPIDLVTPDVLNADYQLFFSNNTGETMTVNSAITVSGGQVTATGNSHTLDFNDAQFNGSVVNTTAQGVNLSLSGTSVIGASANLTGVSGMSFSGTTTIDAGANLGAGSTNLYGALDLSGAVSTPSTDTIYITSPGITISQTTADTSNLNGEIGDYSAGPTTYSAVAGGRLNINGEIYTGAQEVISGDGTVVFADPAGNGYASGYRTTSLSGSGDPASNTEVGTEVKSGTLLLDNTSGSATGDGAAQPAIGGYNNVVQVDNNTTGTVATLGGYGYTSQNVVAMGAKSVIAPGDPTVNGGVGILHLQNGLTAVNGLTMDFTLTADPSASSQIQLAVTGNNGAAPFALQLGGTVTIDLSGTINTDDVYTLVESSSSLQWSIDSQTAYVVEGAPAGYEGLVYYQYNIADQEKQLNIVFEAVPEPSTWALLGFGSFLVIGAGALRRMRA